MKILFIGGTGTISTAITKAILERGRDELYLLNRGNRNADLPAGAKIIQVDVNKEGEVEEKIKELQFDVVADFIAFGKGQLERDYRLFAGKTRQFIFISSASAYQKPFGDYLIDEGTALANPYWEYSRNKIVCEEYLMDLYRKEGFPVTIVRPSHTYDERSVPMGFKGKGSSWQVIKRMMEGKQIIVHGDGTSLWTMTHNSDFAQGFIGLMGNVHALGEAIQITSDESLSWNQVYRTIADILGVEYKPYYIASEYLAELAGGEERGGLLGDKANTVVFDNSKIKRLAPGFIAKTTYREGVANTINNILANPELQGEDPEFDAWCDKVIDELEAAKRAIPKLHA